MKLFFRLILIGLLTFFLSVVFPWWIIVPIGMIIGWLIPGGSFNAFVSGFLGVGIVWMGYAWKLDAANESQFTMTILEILPLSDPITLVALVGFIGGLMGGLSTMTGCIIRQPAKSKKSSGYYN